MGGEEGDLQMGWSWVRKGAHSCQEIFRGGKVLSPAMGRW